ncbi:MAG: phosphoenolpyruvate hydrolase family protein [Microbacteriaceae bacterium]|nr:phosphoenolpyruvate hydrolase family protein [Microbacteriaceae bacterium]
MTRDDVLARARDRLAAGRILLAAGAGIGLSAKCAAEGGADFIVVYNSGKFRMAGRGSTAGYLAYGDANAIVESMAPEIIPMANGVPVIAGVMGTDPFRDMRQYLERLKTIGYVGVQNFPTVGLIDGKFRQSLEETGMGFQAEVDLIRVARELDLVTVPYVFNEQEATRMAEAGADVVVAHMGVTVKGLIGARTSMSLEEAAERCQSIRDAAIAVNPAVLVHCHGGPIAEPSDVEYIVRATNGISGFFAASSTERIPTEVAMTQRVREFSQLG